MTTVEIRSDSDNITADMIRTAIQAELKRLELGLQKTERHIEKFESAYNISSETFLTKFTAEDMKGGDSEYVAWAGELKIRERIQADMTRLREIQYVAQ